MAGHISVHVFDSTDSFTEEIVNARVWGGMHFRHSVETGQALGRQVARAVVARFGRGP